MKTNEKLTQMQKKAVNLILVILLLAVLSLGFFACSRNGKGNGGQAAKERVLAAEEFENSLLCGLDPDWSRSLSDDKAATLNNAGDYILTLEWVKFASGLLSASALPSAKISAVSDALKSEAGIKLLRNENLDGTQLLGLFTSVGFTSVDISELLYDVIEAILSDYHKVFTACENNFNTLKNNKNLTAAANASISAAQIALSNSKKSFDEFASDKDDIMRALDEAREGVESLISFAYDLSVSPFTGKIIGSDLSGEMQEITDGEFKTYIGSFISSVDSLKSTLNDGRIEKINAAFKLLLNKFDNLVFNSKTFDKIISAISDRLHDAYISVDFIPTVLKLISAGGKGVDDKFIEVFRAYAQSDLPIPKENRVIFMSRYLLAALDGTDKTSAVDYIESIVKRALKDYAKASAIFNYDARIGLVVVNESFSMAELFSMTEKERAKIIDFSVKNGDLKAFKEAYAKYLISDRIYIPDELRMKTESLMNYIGTTPHSPIYSEPWYNEMLDLYDKKNRQVIADHKEAVIKDICEMVEAIFERLLPLAREAADTDIVRSTDDPRYERLLKLDYYLFLPLIFDGTMPK